MSDELIFASTEEAFQKLADLTGKRIKVAAAAEEIVDTQVKAGVGSAERTDGGWQIHAYVDGDLLKAEFTITNPERYENFKATTEKEIPMLIKDAVREKMEEMMKKYAAGKND